VALQLDDMVDVSDMDGGTIGAGAGGHGNSELNNLDNMHVFIGQGIETKGTGVKARRVVTRWCVLDFCGDQFWELKWCSTMLKCIYISLCLAFICV
jgi:hypothetical protein